MNRLTIDLIRESMAKTNIKLSCDEWMNVMDNCGCPMAIFFMARSPHPEPIESAAEAFCNSFFDKEYVDGFTNGFDLPIATEDWCLISIGSDERTIVGFRDGQHARHELLPCGYGLAECFISPTER